VRLVAAREAERGATGGVEGCLRAAAWLGSLCAGQLGTCWSCSYAGGGSGHCNTQQQEQQH
jgi:hypothetical protein